MVWWTRELWGLRHCLRKAHKTWIKNKNDNNKITLRSAKARHQKALREAKLKSLNEFCGLLNTDFSAAMRFVTTKALASNLPATLKIDNELTSDPVRILEACAKHFFPLELLSNDAHRITENDASSALLLPDATAVPVVTQQELASAIAELKHSTATGPDGISAELFIACEPHIAPVLKTIYSKCLELG